MPNAFAFIILILWPAIALVIKKNVTGPRAVAIAIIAPYLFLPTKVAIDLPGVPAMDKETIAAFMAFALFLWGNKDYAKLPQNFMIKVLFISLFALPLIIVFTNQESYVFGPTVVSGLPKSDFLALNFKFLSDLYIPFLLGVTVFRTKESQIEMLKVLMALGLVYTLFMLWEIRMSPQLHTNLYGFFPHSFAQMRRAGGFRPVVFLGHGLLVALFAVMLAITAAYFFKNKIKYISKWPGITVLYLVVVVILCKTYAAYLYALIFLPTIFLFNTKNQLRVCAAITIIVFTFPILRMNELVPVYEIRDFMATISEERAQSYGFRLDQEEGLLAKASQKPYFGWGGWGRSLLYDERTGKQTSISDGYWIIIYGYAGLVGYLIYYGLYSWPIFLFYRLNRKYGEEEDYKITTCLVMMVTMVLLDSIPNAGFSIVSTMMAGAIMGRAIDLKKDFAIGQRTRKR